MARRLPFVFGGGRIAPPKRGSRTGRAAVGAGLAGDRPPACKVQG